MIGQEDSYQKDFDFSEDTADVVSTTTEANEDGVNLDLTQESNNEAEVVQTKVNDNEGETIEEQPSDSSLTSDSDDSNLEDNSIVADSTPSTEVTEEMLLSKLSEKLGREVTSFDDFNATSSEEEDPYMKGLLEWRKKTGRPIEDYAKFQKDYSQVDDIQVAREFLQIEYPTLTPEEIEFELERNFIADEEVDLDDEIKLKNLELKKYASKGRPKLQEMVKEFGSPTQANLPPELQDKIQYADSIKAELEGNRTNEKKYLDNIKKIASNFDSISLNLTEGLDIDFKVETPKDDIYNMIESAPHWKNEDGTPNPEAVVRDAAIIANYKKMIQIAYEQGLNSGKDEVIKEAKNTTLGTAAKSMSTTTKGSQIEGLDGYLGKKGLSIKFGK
jgi:hypothetical protein